MAVSISRVHTAPTNHDHQHEHFGARQLTTNTERWPGTLAITPWLFSARNRPPLQQNNKINPAVVGWQVQFTAKGRSCLRKAKAENEELRQHVADLQGMLQQAEETEAGEDTEPVTGGDCDAGAADAATQAAFQFFVGEIEKQTYPKMMHKVARQFRIIQVMNAMGYVPADHIQMRDLGSKQGDVDSAFKNNSANRDNDFELVVHGCASSNSKLFAFPPRAEAVMPFQVTGIEIHRAKVDRVRRPTGARFCAHRRLSPTRPPCRYLPALEKGTAGSFCLVHHKCR